MEYKTKFNLGDKVWTMRFDKPYSFTIGKVEIYDSPDQHSIVYYRGEDNKMIKEMKCFSSKNELLDSFRD